MTTFPPFPGFDGLMLLSRREGVDVRPTLLRVLTDLYVQTPLHTIEEERQYVELASRLIDEVDDATRAVVCARLSIYPKTPPAIADKLALLSPERRSLSEPTTTVAMSMQPIEAVELSGMFLAADARERRLILHNLSNAPRRAAAYVDTVTAVRAVAALETMALEADLIGFSNELAHVLMLPTHVTEQIVTDSGGEQLACAAKCIGMPDEIYQRVLLFLDPELGASVTRVYDLARFYEVLSKHAALVMLAAWRVAYQLSPRGRYRPLLHDEERQRARSMPSKQARIPKTMPLVGARQNDSSS